MVGLILKVLVGVVLFVGSLVGGLAATGRLNHEGTANIPVLNSFFPPPPPKAEGEAGKDGKDGNTAEAAHGKDAATPQDAHATPAGETGHGTPADAGHAKDGEHADGAQNPQNPQEPPVRRTGKSVVNPEKPPDAGGGHGGGHGGGEEKKDGHGEAKGGHGDAKDGHGDTKDAHGTTDHGMGSDPNADEHGKGAHGTPEQDFGRLEDTLANGSSQYRPGALFRFDGLPANLTPEQINQAWQSVQGLMAEIERRRVALDQREKELREQQDDVGRRQKDLGDMQARLDEMQRAIDAKIAKFQEQVKLVRTDEVAALKRNAQSLSSFEPTKSAEMIQDLWKTEKGQDEALRTMEFMDKDAVNEILKVLPTPMAQDVMNKRLRVSKEPATSGKPK